MVQWCNDNAGFISAILTLLTILLSVIAIIVSIQTARLPYKKKLKLYSNYKFAVWDTPYGNKSELSPMSITIGAVNLGNRPINLEFLGLGIFVNGRLKKFTPLNRSLNCKGIIECTEMKEVDYLLQELLAPKDTLQGTLIYACAIDSEGKIYTKKIGLYDNIINSLTA